MPKTPRTVTGRCSCARTLGKRRSIRCGLWRRPRPLLEKNDETVLAAGGLSGGLFEINFPEQIINQIFR